MSESEEARKARLAQALRDNLRRRKAQSREQKADDAKPGKPREDRGPSSSSRPAPE